MDFRTSKQLPAFLISLLVFSACTPHEEKEAPQARKPATGMRQPPVELGEIWGQVNEDQTQEVLDSTRNMLVERSKDASFLRRDAHPKHHGCVKAQFKIDASQLPQDLRTGIFADGAAKDYSAWLRFSNGDPDGATAFDNLADVRGLAIKLMNVTGAESGSQDFVLCTAKEFFSKDGADYVELHKALSKGKLATAWYAITHRQEIGILDAAKIRTDDAILTKYYSALPYKLGGLAAKYKVTACPGTSPAELTPNPATTANFLRTRLIGRLAKADACLDFWVQPGREPGAQPVENPMIAWDEIKSPYIKVATVVIPRQTEIDSEAHLNFCENINFDPWHTLPENRPLGQIGRMRGEIYPAISQLRHEFNQVPQIEPTSHDACTGNSAPLCKAPKH